MLIIRSRKSFYKSIIPPLALGAFLCAPLAHAQDLPSPVLPPQAALCVPLTAPDDAPPALWHFTRQPCPEPPQQTIANAPPGDGVVVRVRPVPGEDDCWGTAPVHPSVLSWLQMLWGRGGEVPQGGR